MRKHLVVVLGLFYPQPSPNGRCAWQLINILMDKYDVSVVCMQSTNTVYFGKSIEGVRLYTVCNLRTRIEVSLSILRNAKKSIVFLKAIDLLIKAVKGAGRVQSMLQWPNNMLWFRNKAYHQLEQIDDECAIDVILTVNSPFSAHLAGQDFKKKHPSIRWVTYTVDPWLRSMKTFRFFNSRKIVRDEKAECSVYCEADLNMVSEEIFLAEKELFKNIEAKVYELPYMMTPRKCAQNDKFDDSQIKLLFAGRFYRDIRNPEYFLKTFASQTNPNLVLHLDASGDCEDIIDKYVSIAKGRIVKHQQVSLSEIQTIMSCADVLINISNSVPEFRPSKIFEYISTGVPIINFYKYVPDEVLAQHPQCLQVHENAGNIERNIAEFGKFCADSKGKKVGILELETIYEKHSRTNIEKLLTQYIV